MAYHKPRHKVVLTLGLVISLLAPIIGASWLPATASSLSAEQVSFVPNVTPLVIEDTPQPTLPSEFDSTGGVQGDLAPDALQPPIMVPLGAAEYAICGFLTIGSESYPIGEPIEDPGGIPLSTIVSADPFGRAGFAELRDHPDYRLVWVTTEGGDMQSMIVHKADPLYNDPSVGFQVQADTVRDGYKGMFAAGVPALTAAGTLITAGIVGCAPTAGGGCALAVGAAIVGGIVASVAEWYIKLTVVNPAIENLQLKMGGFELNRGSGSAACVPS